MYARLDVISRNLEFTGAMHRAYYQPMLDRIAGDQPSLPLRVLADVTEALGLGAGRTGYPTGTMPLNRFVDACLPESELARSLELAAKRFAASPATDKDDAALLRRQFQTWAVNDAALQPLAANNKLLTEAVPLSKDLSMLGEAGLKMLDAFAPPVAPDAKAKKLSKREKQAQLEAEKAAAAAKKEWMAKLNVDLTRLAQTPKRPAGGQPSTLPDVRLAAYRPVKVLADVWAQK
jgi:plasmid stabilization system protein ParE